MSLTIFTLGLPKVEIDGTDLTGFQRQKLRLAMLAWVGVEGTVTRDRTIGLFWPDRPPEAARHLLSQTLYEIRQDLPIDPFVVEGDRIRIGEEVTVDAVAFEAAVAADAPAEACRLYRARFMDGTFLWRTSEWEHWVDAQEGRLARLHRKARRLLLAELNARGALKEALAAARTWAELHPADDEAHHSVIDLLARTGQRKAALKYFDEYASRLRDDELEPLDDTRALIEEIRGGLHTDAPVAPAAAISAQREADEASGVGSGALGPGLDIIRTLGTGSMAVVYLAREVTLRRVIAVKLLSAEVAADATARLRFQREAEAAARIQHPNVVPVYWVGTAPSGRPFMAMPYIRGGSLAERVQAWGPPSLDEALRALRDIGAGLAAAHRLGVIHRDVRAANVLYEQETGRCLLCDFGLAAIVDELTASSVRLTRTGEWVGNPSCVSPEQLLGQPISPRTDVYGLGNLAFTLLAGRSPFDASGPAEFTIAHVRSAPHRLDRFRDDVPQPIVDLVDRSLAKRPEHRPTADEFVAALG